MKPGPARWRRVDAIFDGALDLEPEERDRYLVEVCGDDEALKAEVQSLLDAADDGSEPSLSEFPHFLEALGAELAGPAVAGRHVGPYRVIELLGRGGMGAVFLAERADGAFEKRVAIKILPWNMAGPDLEERFALERQILADLEHPNVARLLDGGTTEDGVPYLVMEHVDGVPIDEFCEANELTADDRLELFLQVCDAVVFAHQNMVVHRDLKPSNIVVAADGVPKLLDFGIAKLLDPATPSSLTRGDARPLTPAWAAPEQLKGEPASARSDVYALGGLLYLLLTGRTAHDLEGLSFAETLERVSEAAPSPPSEKARTRARRLAGDLDAIVLQAMAADPSQRYRTVEALMEDLRRHLEGRPVAARRPTVAYRARKLVRRNPVAVVAGGLVALSILVSLALAVRQLHVEERQRRRAERVSHFLTDLLTVVDPDSGTGTTLDVRELLDRGIAEARAKLADEPELRAEILTVLGEAAHGRELYERARDLHREALEIRRQLSGPGSAAALTAAGELGWALGLAGDTEAADSLLRETIQLARRHQGEGSEAHADALHSWASLAINARFASDLVEREELGATLRTSLRMRRALYGGDHPKIVAVLHDLAYTTEDPREKEGRLRQALAMQRRMFDGPNEATARITNDLALVLESRGRTDEAIRFMAEASAIHRDVYGHEHPVTIRILNNLAGVLRDADRPEEAESRYREVLDLSGRLYPAGDRRIAFPLYGLGRVLLAQGELSEAEDRLREARQILVASEDPLQHVAASALGETLMRQSRFEDARRLLEDSLPALEATEGFETYADRTRERLRELHRARDG